MAQLYVRAWGLVRGACLRSLHHVLSQVWCTAVPPGRFCSQLGVRDKCSLFITLKAVKQKESGARLLRDNTQNRAEMITIMS